MNTQVCFSGNEKNPPSPSISLCLSLASDCGLVNRRIPTPTPHTSHCKRQPKKGKRLKGQNLFSPFKSFPLHFSISYLYLQNKGESNSQPANTHSTDPTAPACITYSQPPPSSGSAADAGLSPTIFSYSCGPTQTTHVYLATATNAPASASTHTPITISNLPIYAYVLIGIGGVLVLIILSMLWRCCTSSPPLRTPYVQRNHPTPSRFPDELPNYPTPSQLPSYPTFSPYRCRHCNNTNLTYDTVKPGNPLGNDGRPYYVCLNRNCSNYTVNKTNAGQGVGGWVTWDDNIGVEPGNPLCRCRPPRRARKDTAATGRHFWTCSTGACDYWGNAF